MTRDGRRIAIVDIDAHQGNGTQEIFWHRGDVFYASVHVDPGAGWYPHFAGYADETGEGDGVGTNLNVTLPEGTGDAGWLAGVDHCSPPCDAHGSDAVVVSLGVDAAVGDPNSPLEVTAAGFREAGAESERSVGRRCSCRRAGTMLATLGPFVLEVLHGFESSHG